MNEHLGTIGEDQNREKIGFVAIFALMTFQADLIVKVGELVGDHMIMSSASEVAGSGMLSRMERACVWGCGQAALVRGDRSLTLAWGLSPNSVMKGWRWEWHNGRWLNQGSNQRLILSPLPIINLRFLARSGLSLKISVQIREDLAFLLTSQKFLPLNSSRFTHFAQPILVALLTSFQPSLSMNEVLVSLGLLIPNPPSLVGVQMSAQATLAPLNSRPPLHRKFLSIHQSCW